ncbi:hypothetical protein pb186bvf_000514 [Paramecium bursaria]
MCEYFKDDLEEYQKLLVGLDFQSTQHLHQFDQVSENKSNISQFLRAKNAMMIRYLLYLYKYFDQKINRGSLEQYKEMDKLLESKILIQKMGLTQKKLQYQIDKLSKINEEQQIEQSDDEDNENAKISYKPRVDNLQKDQQQKLQDKYIAPKLSAVLSKKDQVLEKQKRKHLELKNKQKANLIKSVLDDQQTDRPAVVTEEEYQQRYIGRSEDKRAKEKRLYEEEMMFRLPQTKDELRKEKKAERIANSTHLDDFTGFETLTNLFESKKQKKTVNKVPRLKGTMKKKFKKRK